MGPQLSRSTCGPRAEFRSRASAPVGRVLVVFLDGVGIGPPDPDVNPFLRANLPTLSAALGGSLPTLDMPRIDAIREQGGDGFRYVAVDRAAAR